jgi:hypothetical protein
MRASIRQLAMRYPALRRLSRSAPGQWISRRLLPRPAPPPGYARFRSERPTARRDLYPARLEPGLLSFVTTVWNTDPAYVRALADTVFAQDAGTDFEWYILDNGSMRAETVALLAELAAHPCVRLERVEQNLGIIGGMRRCLERARNRYILPLDSDDLLTLDCVRIFAWHIERHGRPALVYSDEDKLDDAEYRDPYFKPDWDPVLFVHSCYIAHLCAIDRALALEYGAYSDPVAEGCHDWDTFMRFSRAGHVPVHVPEIVYSWRMHPQSTSGNIQSKPVVYESHARVLNRFIDSNPHPERFELRMSELFGGTPDWRIVRRRLDPRPVVTALMCESASRARAEFHSDGYPGHRTVPVPIAAGLEPLARVARDVAERGGLVHLLWEQVAVAGGDWPWEALGLMELFPGTVMVGGRIHSTQHRILAAGAYFGFGGGCDTPDRGRLLGDPGYFAQMWKPHAVSAVSSQHAMVDARFLHEALRELIARSTRASLPYLGAWLGAAARRRGESVVYTPFFLGCAGTDWDARVSSGERHAFVRTNLDLMPERRLLSTSLGLDSSSACQPVSAEQRSAHLRALGIPVGDSVRAERTA